MRLGLSAVLGLGLLAFAYAAWDHTVAGRTTFTVLGYDVVSDHSVVVRFEVRKKGTTSVVCEVRARDRDGVEVGKQDVNVGAGVTELSHRLATTRRAALGEVTGCSSP